MITLLIALAFAGGCFSAAYFAAGWGIGWSIFAALAGFVVFQGVVGLLIQKRVKRDMDRVQAILAAGQKRVQTKMQRWQIRPPGSVQAAQREIFDDTKIFVREAIRETEVLSKYRFWVPMIKRQQATARLQLHWMIKEFSEVDRLLPQALILDPNLAAIKMARFYQLEKPTEEIRKVYEQAVRRVRYNGNVLLAAAMSWILVKRNDADGAFKVLTEALKKSDNDTLKANHEHLMNNRLTHFTNSGIGDMWYSLYLEEPKVHAQRQRSVYR